MKKMIIMWALTSLAFAVQSEIINGNFSGTGTNLIATSALFGNPIGDSTGPLNKGWYTNDVSSQSITITGGEAVRTTVGPGSFAGIAQFFTSTSNGPASLNFDVQLTDANSNLQFGVILYGYKYSTAFNPLTAVMTSSDSARLIVHTSANLPASSASWTVTQLVKYDYINGGTLNGGTYKTVSTNFTASTSSYDLYGIRIVANHPDTADNLRFDNVAIGAAVLPATMFFIK